MKKCPNCNSCLTRIHIDSNLYYFCDLCLEVYRSLPNYGIERVGGLEQTRLKERIREFLLWKQKR